MAAEKSYLECDSPLPNGISIEMGDTKLNFIPSPPPDVVEAAKRLEAWKNSANWNAHEYITDGTYDQDEDIETVCNWIIQQAAPGKP